MITLPSNEDASTQLSSFQLAGSLTSPERRAFSVATLDASWGEQDQPPETAYLAVLPAARRSILLRLIGGLLRDRPEPLSDPSIVAPDEQVDETSEALPRIDLDLSSVRKDCGVSGTISELAVLPFPAAETLLVVPVERAFGFARFWLTTPVVTASSSTTTAVRQPSQIVHLLKQEGIFPDSSHAERFAREIDESVANLALAYLAKETFKSQFADVQGGVFDGLCQREVPAADPLAFFERLVTDGHPFHPGAKIRRGMTPSDSLTYAPEFTDRIALRFMAMRREETLDSTVSEETLTGRLLELFPGLQTAVTENLPPKTSLSEYAVIPVHPWQYTRALPDRVAPLVDTRTLVPIQGYSVPVSPLLSLRTVVPYAPETTVEAPPHLKLALDVRLTNTIRTLAPESIYNGPRLSRILCDIEATGVLPRFGLMAEEAATCYYPSSTLQPAEDCCDTTAHVSALMRQTPYTHPLVTDASHVIPIASLRADSPTSGQPIVCDLIDAFARTTETTCSSEVVEAFLDAYCQAVIPGPLTLLSKYGIALEAHPQNTCLVVDEGVPVASLARDLAGVRLDPARLTTAGYEIETYPESTIVADDVTALHNKLYYALFQNHLAELIITVTRQTAIDEETCWDCVRRQCRETFTDLQTDERIPEIQLERDEAVLFGETMAHKALTAMRLRGNTYDYITTPVPNPLAE